MRDRHDFDFGRGFTKYHKIRKPTKYLPAGIECQLRKLVRTLLNPLQRGAKLNYESSRCVRAAMPVPFHGGFGFESRLRVNPDRFHSDGTLAQRRRSTSSQGSMATAPVSISCKRF